MKNMMKTIKKFGKWYITNYMKAIEPMIKYNVPIIM